ncbi:uncharacterized protein LOC142238094 [Haematobia irritans]|uniref:uncharacterized protein LOC142238094 n=1 Tax=Haematobia irritans TaxID=7368 RepID=UPI003F4F41E1
MFPSNNTFGHQPFIQQIELYPSRRATEYYSEPQPAEEYQSRAAEHPYDKLGNRNITENDQIGNGQRIMPPRNFDMHVFRNSHYS